MKKLTAVVPANNRAVLLRGLSRLRAVQLRQLQFEDETAEKEALRVPPVREDTEDARVFARAVEIITKHKAGKTKGGFFTPLPEVTSEEFFERRDSQYELYLEYAREIGRQETRLRYLTAEAGRLDAEIASLEPWAASSVPLQFAGTKTTKAVRFTCPVSVSLTALENAVSDATPLAQLTEIFAGEELRYLVLIANAEVFEAAAAAIKARSCAEAHFRDITGTAAENIRTLRNKKTDGESEAKFIASRLEYEAKHLDELRLFSDISTTEESLSRSEDKLYETEATAVVYAWYEAAHEEKIREVLVRHGAAYEFEDVVEEEYADVPVKLNSGRISRPLNMVTDMYALPLYGTVDPNPLMMPFFVLFYGMMMADMAYGIIMFVLGQLVLSKKKPTGGTRDFFGLMRLCGVSTFIIGIFTGSFFGDALFKYVELINPATTFKAFPWPTFDMLQGNNTLIILIAAMALGFVHIVAGMAIKFVQTCRAGHPFDAIFDQGSWWVVFAGLALGALGITWIPCLVGVGMLILTQGRAKKGIVGKLVGGLASLYDIMSYFGDILSYSRIMSLMLAGSVISLVFNTLAQQTGPIAFFFVFIFGHALNFALNLLGCYVHDLRLQCLEYFGKFYEDGGKPFAPISIKAKHYKVN